MLRKPKLFNDDFLNEVGSLKDIAKLKNIGVANPAPTTEFDPTGTSYPELEATNPSSFGDIRKNESPYYKLGRFIGNQQIEQEQRPNALAIPESVQKTPQPSLSQAGFNPAEFIPKNISQAAKGLIGGNLPENVYKALSGIAGYLSPNEEQPEIAAQEPNAPELAPQQPTAINAPQVALQGPETTVSPAEQIKAQVAERQEAGEAPIFAAPQAVETALGDPQSKSIIEKLFGGKIDENQMQELINMEKALTEQALSTDEEIAHWQQKIKNNELTTTDKVLMGLALLAPAIIGGVVAGPEGIFKALGGGLEGFAEGLKTQEEGHVENLERLAAAKERKSNIQEAKVALSQSVLDSIPNAALRKALANRGIEVIEDPNGGIEAYGISTTAPNLFIDANRIHSEADLKRFDDKEVPDMKEADELILQINDALDDADYILDQLKGITPAGQILTSNAKFLAKDIMTREGDIINANEALNTVNEVLKDRYSKTLKARGLTEAVVEHFKGLLANPYQPDSIWEGRNLNTIISKTRQFRGLMNKAHERKLESTGFLVQPFKKRIGENEFVQKATNERKANKAQKYLREHPEEWEKALEGKLVGGK